jgi:hypothetical protein
MPKAASCDKGTLRSMSSARFVHLDSADPLFRLVRPRAECPPAVLHSAHSRPLQGCSHPAPRAHPAPTAAPPRERTPTSTVPAARGTARPSLFGRMHPRPLAPRQASVGATNFREPPPAAPFRRWPAALQRSHAATGLHTAWSPAAQHCSGDETLNSGGARLVQGC